MVEGLKYFRVPCGHEFFDYLDFFLLLPVTIENLDVDVLGERCEGDLQSLDDAILKVWAHPNIIQSQEAGLRALRGKNKIAQ